MAVILTLDRANVRGKKRPKIKALTVDGYLLYAEKQDPENADRVMTAMGAHIQNTGVTALGLARELMQIGIGEDVYHNLREEIARIANKERNKRLEERRNNARSGDDGGAAGRTADAR